MRLNNAIKACTITRNPSQEEFLGTLPTEEEITQYWRDRAIEKYRKVEKYLEHDKKTGLFVSISDHLKVTVGESQSYNRYTISDGGLYETLVVPAKELLKLFYGKEKSLDVHHINGKKTDDRIENIRFMSHEDHARLHIKRIRRRMREIGEKQPRLPTRKELDIAERKHLYRQIIKSVEARN